MPALAPSTHACHQAIALMVLKQSDDPKFPLYGELPSPAVAGHLGPPGAPPMGVLPPGGPFHPGLPFLPPLGMPGAPGAPGMWGGALPPFGGPPAMAGAGAGGRGGAGGGRRLGAARSQWPPLSCIAWPPPDRNPKPLLSRRAQARAAASRPST